MKQLLNTNCYDTKETMIMIGTCLKVMQPKAYEELKKMSENMYEICLEETHMNMAVTKVMGMIARKEIKHIIFASVDKSPHCIQLHYMVKEIENNMDLSNLKIENYVAVNDRLIKVNPRTIALSKNLTNLQEEIGDTKVIDKIALIKVKDKKILSTLSKGKDTWYIPGGKREKSENDIETLTREIKEELKVAIKEDTIKYYGTFKAQAHGKKEGMIVKMTCYTADYEGVPVPSSEIDKMEWLTYKDIDRISPVDQIIFKDLHEKGVLE